MTQKHRAGFASLALFSHVQCLVTKADLAALQIVSLMKVAPVTEDDKGGKAALFTKYVEALPHALDSWKDSGLGLVSRLLLGIQKVVQHNTALHQNLFRSVAVHMQAAATATDQPIRSTSEPAQVTAHVDLL